MTSSVDGERSGYMLGINALPDDALRSLVLERLPLCDSIRARAVCRRWRDLVRLDSAHLRNAISSSGAQSYCPLIFMRNEPSQHSWCGYDSTSGKWEPLPPLHDLPQVDIRPLAGNGKSLLGFRITTELSQVIVGNPYTGDWRRIPRSADAWGEAGSILLVDGTDSTTFRIIAIREEETEVYSSRLDDWTKVRQRPPDGSMQESVTVDRIKDKLCATLCDGFLFCYCTQFLISFDLRRERWTDDRIPLPHHSSLKSFQLLECAGLLFAAIEDTATSTVTVWVLGLKRRQFFCMVAMPGEFHSVLCKNGNKGRYSQLKAVGHRHRMFFWRNKSLSIIAFDFLKRTWDVLPDFEQFIDPRDRPELEIVVDTGSFEP